MTRAGLPVPDGFVVGAPAYAARRDEGERRILRGRSGTWHRAVVDPIDFCDAPIPRRALKDPGFCMLIRTESEQLKEEP